MRTINDAVQVLRELKELEAGGVVLPYPAATILKMELAGHTVNLETGEVVIGGGSVRRRPTDKGQTQGG